MRVAGAARVVAVGIVANLGEQLSAVQPLRGVVMVSVVSGSGKLGEQLSAVIMVSVVNGE